MDENSNLRLGLTNRIVIHKRIVLASNLLDRLKYNLDEKLTQDQKNFSLVFLF